MRNQDFLKFLVSESLIDPAKAKTVMHTAGITHERIDTTILDMRLLSEDLLLEKLGEFSKSRTCSAQDLSNVGPESAGLISPRVATRFGVVPFRREGRNLDIAALSPEDFLIQDELRVLTGCMIRTYAVLELRLQEALSRLYGIGLPLRFETLIRRLAHKGTAPVLNTPEQVEKKPVPEIPKPSATPATPQPKKTPRPSELEISEEDLKLFPSLIGEEESAGGVSSESIAPLPPLPPLPTKQKEKPLTEDDDDIDLELRFSRTSDLLQNAEMRDDIADALFYFCRPFFRRRMLLTIRKNTIVGWRCEGAGLDQAAIRAIEIPQDEPSAFLALLQGTPFWLGPLPPMARNQELIMAMGPPQPDNCLILPIRVRGKTVAFFYGDSADDVFPPPPMAELKRLMSKTDLAFQVYLLKGKIRTI